VDVSDVTKTSSAATAVAKAPEAVSGQPPKTVGNSLPNSAPIPVRTEDPADTNQAPQLNTVELNSLVDEANLSLQGRFSDLKFTVAEGTDINVVRIEDAETGELIRQVPSEAMVAIARALDEAQRGMVLEEKA